jgi:mannose-6-phosphate isomerase-like protein (cupin superfamily)
MMTARFAALMFALAQAGGAAPVPATDITAADVQRTLKQAIATKATDIPIRTVDAGGHNIGVGLVHRPKGTNLPGGASHDKVSEVYHVLEGAGTLVTGGTLVSPQRREGASEVVTQINGPGYSGTSIAGGVRRRIAKGDIVIIPAGTPHWFPEVEEDITYTVVRVDPGKVVTLK